MNSVVIKPLGKVLKQAGLVSDSQITTALKIQSKNNQIPFGKILVKQGILKQKTVDFFAQKFPILLQRLENKPLGYYFKEAALITPPQIETLLKEQKQTGMLLGELALEKRLIKPKTLNFFLQNLVQINNNFKLKLNFLTPYQQEIIQPFHLETQAAAPASLIKEVFYWTEGHPLLTQEIFQLISNYDYYFIPAGMEVFWVKILVQKSVIHNWRNQALGEYLKTLENYLLNNKNDSPQNLLETYLHILKEKEFKINFNETTKELINLGLVTEKYDELKVSNPIYQAIFNVNWVREQLFLLRKNPQTNRLNAKQIAYSTKIKIQNESLAKISGKIILVVLLLISPVVIFLNNSQHQVAKEIDSLISQENNKLTSTEQSSLISSENNNLILKADNNFASQSLSNSNFCTAPIPTKVTTQENWRIHLEQEKQKLQEQFPDNCQNNLDQLLVQLNPRNQQFYQNYQQALISLEQSDYEKALEQLYQAAEKAIIADKADLLLREIVKQEQTSLKAVSQQTQDWQFLQETLIKADPHDYQLLYQRAKLKLTTDHNYHHNREFELLFAAAKKAIDNQKTEMMLSQLKQDQKNRFKNLSIGHSEWSNLLKALEQNNKQFLN